MPQSDHAREASALAAVEHHIPPDLRQGLEILLSQSADPQAALMRLDRFCASWPGEFQQIAYTPFGLQALVAVFSASNFLSEELQQHPLWLLGILQSGWLHRTRSGEEIEAELEDWIGPRYSASLSAQAGRIPAQAGAADSAPRCAAFQQSAGDHGGAQ
ncbi:MAG: hypothetical protein IPP47_32815 [Bryobacterales bacterium]|nr:hypothetical protein [Bryobacterales bacterium]